VKIYVDFLGARGDFQIDLGTVDGRKGVEWGKRRKGSGAMNNGLPETQ